MEDAVNAQHIWVVAYDKGGMRLIPATSNPFTQTLTKYEDTTPFFDWKKQLAANLFVGNKTEENEYIPYSAVTSAVVDESRKKVVLQIGNVKKSFKYQTKDFLELRRMKHSMRFSGTSKVSKKVTIIVREPPTETAYKKTVGLAAALMCAYMKARRRF